MPAYSFQQRFVPALLAGLEPGPWVPGMKRMTIRAPRKRAPRLGALVHLFAGMRTRDCRKLGAAPSVIVLRVAIGWGAEGFTVGPTRKSWVAAPVRRAELPSVLTDLWIKGQLHGEQLHALAQADGFADAAEMEAFFGRHLSVDRPDQCWAEFDLIAWAPAGGSHADPR